MYLQIYIYIYIYIIFNILLNHIFLLDYIICMCFFSVSCIVCSFSWSESDLPLSLSLYAYICLFVCIDWLTHWFKLMIWPQQHASAEALAHATCWIFVWCYPLHDITSPILIKSWWNTSQRCCSGTSWSIALRRATNLPAFAVGVFRQKGETRKNMWGPSLWLIWLGTLVSIVSYDHVLWYIKV